MGWGVLSPISPGNLGFAACVGFQWEGESPYWHLVLGSTVHS